MVPPAINARHELYGEQLRKVDFPTALADRLPKLYDKVNYLDIELMGAATTAEIKHMVDKALGLAYKKLENYNRVNNLSPGQFNHIMHTHIVAEESALEDRISMEGPFLPPQKGDPAYNIFDTLPKDTEEGRTYAINLEHAMHIMGEPFTSLAYALVSNTSSECNWLMRSVVSKIVAAEKKLKDGNKELD